MGKEAWIRQVGSTLELRMTGSADVIASATNEVDAWCVRLPRETVFVGSDVQARTLLWKTAATSPVTPPPTAKPRPARPRVGFDYFNGGAA